LVRVLLETAAVEVQVVHTKRVAVAVALAITPT
jgi:hypothetical protein